MRSTNRSPCDGLEDDDEDETTALRLALRAQPRSDRLGDASPPVNSHRPGYWLITAIR